MRTSAATAWPDGGLALDPGAPPGKSFQRIFPSRWSDWLKESRPADAEDASLLLRTRQGDAAAFEALIRQHQRMIYSLTYRMTGSAADAEDLTQETFLRAWRQIGSYRAAAKFSTWLYRIAINACLTWRQRETVARTSPGRLGRDQWRARSGRGNSPGPQRNGPHRPCRPAHAAGQAARRRHAHPVTTASATPRRRKSWVVRKPPFPGGSSPPGENCGAGWPPREKERGHEAL